MKKHFYIETKGAESHKLAILTAMDSDAIPIFVVEIDKEKYKLF